MPSIKDSLGQDLSAYSPVEKSSIQAALPPTQIQEPVLNTMIRCPLPTLFQVSPDNLRQFYQAGQVPQIRIFAPSSGLAPSSGGNGNVSVTSSSSSGGGSVTPSMPATSQSISINTGSTIGPNGTYTGTMLVSKSFQLLSIATSSPARVQLYGTLQAQLGDATRGLDVPPPAGTAQNIICDVVLDTRPLQWSFQDRVGANADSPQTTFIYVRLTNLDVSSDVITLTLVYVPLES